MPAPLRARSPGRNLSTHGRVRRCALTALLGLFLCNVLVAEPVSPGPAVRSTKATAVRSGLQGADIRESWYSLPEGRDMRTGSCMYDNGLPLDDEGTPASQLSNPAGVWPAFIGGAADDFTITGGTPGMDCHITLVRTAFRFFAPGADTATPRTTFQGVYITIYYDASGQPSGAPTLSGGQTGTYLVSRFVPASSLLNQTLVGTCAPVYQVDIPVDITVAHDVTYWISIVPKFQGPPQSGAALSQASTGSVAVQGLQPNTLPLPVAFWTPISGNTGDCPGSPASGTRKNLAFMLMGDETSTFTGACCNDSSLPCNDGVSKLSCQNANQRFSEGQTCSNLNPPCGTTSGGACCLADGVCQTLTPTDCQNAGGTWNGGLCANSPCSPANGFCGNAIQVSNGVTVFSTIGAITDGPDDTSNPPCTNVHQDVWFKYTSSCTGTVTISLCTGTGFDSALVVYNSWNCAPNLGFRLACSNDFCGDDAQVSFASTANGQYLIRVGGAATASGTGTMSISCVASGTGACCLPDHSCQILTQAQCTSANGAYTGGQPCSALTCPPPVNDLCANAILLTHTVTSFDNRGAGTDGPDETPACPSVNQDIWYKYNATCDGTLQVSLCDQTNFDATLAVYGGCACPPTIGPRLGCDNDGCGAAGGPAKVTVPVSNGQCYLIRVGGNGPAAGTGTIRLDCLAVGSGACCHANLACEIATAANCALPGDHFTPGEVCSAQNCSAPANDICANAIILSSNGSFPFSTAGASTDGPADTPNPPCTSVNQDVWFKYVATCDGQLTASLCAGTAYNAALVVYQGCGCPGALGSILACDNDSCSGGGPASVTLSVANGQCYLIRIGGEGAASGAGQLALTCAPLVVNNCKGDANNDCVVNDADIGFFVNNLLGISSPPPAAVCRSDMNDDSALNGLDIQPFIARLLSGVSCSCCRGDLNGDGLLDGRDVQGMVQAILSPPQPCTVLYRAADVNADDVIDLLDVDALVLKLLAGDLCPVP